MAELPAENNQPDYISTGIQIRDAVGNKDLVIPRDITALEAACLTMFMCEWSQQLVSYRFNVLDRLRHFGLERLLLAGGSRE